jgi:hypothetical protein
MLSEVLAPLTKSMTSASPVRSVWRQGPLSSAPAPVESLVDRHKVWGKRDEIGSIRTSEVLCRTARQAWQ